MESIIVRFTPSRALSLAAFAGLAACLLGSVGCKSDEERALERLAKRKAPGYIRTINLGGDGLELFDGTRLIGRVEGGSARRPTTIPAGSRTLTLKGGKQQDAKLEVEPKLLYTAVIWPDGTLTTLPTGLPRKPTDTENAWVVFASKSGEQASGTAQILGPGGKKIDVSAGKGLQLTPGSYSSLDGSGAGDIEAEFAYTVFVLEDGGKTHVVLSVNSDSIRPSLGGAG